MRSSGLVAAALVASASASSDAQPAAAAPAQLFEVAGLHIGQDMGSAIAALESQGFAVSVIRQAYKGVDGPPTPLKLTAIKKVVRSPVNADKVVAWLSYPPDQPRVLGVYRGFDYEGDGAPTATSIMDAGKAKAGFEVQRRRDDPDTLEQVIRWRPDGKRTGGVAKLFSNLPGTYGVPREPCLRDFLTSGRTTQDRYVDDVGAPKTEGVRRPAETGEGGGSEFNEMVASNFYPKLALRDHKFRIYEGWFAPLPNCGTVYAATIDHDGGGFAKHVRLLLVAQSDMFRNASAYHVWLGARAGEWQRRRLEKAAEPEI